MKITKKKKKKKITATPLVEPVLLFGSMTSMHSVRQTHAIHCKAHRPVVSNLGVFVHFEFLRADIMEL